jgi:ribosomal protein S18 acetylase RimI-like enzyme
MLEISSIEIVRCSWKHHALLAEIGGSTFYETFSSDNSEADMQAYIAKTYNLKQVAENVLNPTIIYYVAYGLNQDLGYIKLLENVSAAGLNGKVLELEKIYVRKEAHGSKVASILMQQAIDIAKEKEYEHLFLGVWQDNERALAFYKKFGFEIFNTRQFKLGERICDDYLLHRVI